MLHKDKYEPRLPSGTRTSYHTGAPFILASGMRRLGSCMTNNVIGRRWVDESTSGRWTARKGRDLAAYVNSVVQVQKRASGRELLWAMQDYECVAAFHTPCHIGSGGAAVDLMLKQARYGRALDRIAPRWTI